MSDRDTPLVEKDPRTNHGAALIMIADLQRENAKLRGELKQKKKECGKQRGTINELLQQLKDGRKQTALDGGA